MKTDPKLRSITSTEATFRAPGATGMRAIVGLALLISSASFALGQKAEFNEMREIKAGHANGNGHANSNAVHQAKQHGGNKHRVTSIPAPALIPAPKPVPAPIPASKPTPAPTPKQGAGGDPTWNGSQTGVNANLWGTAANWTPNAVPGAADTATFSGSSATVGGHTTIDLGGGQSILNMQFDTSSAAAYTIGTGGANGQTLTLSFSGLIDVTSTVTNNQVVNAALTMGTNATSTGSFTFTNDSTTATLTIAGNVNGAGGTNGAHPARTLTLDGAGNGTVSGVINGTGGGNGSNAQPLVSVVKSGGGTWTLTGANTYAGGTTINGGTLLVNNTSGSGTGTGAVTVNNSGTILGGNGTISGSVTVGSGAHLAPGATGAAGSTAILNTGALTLQSGSTFNVDLNSGTVGTGYDQVKVTGAVSILGNLAVNLGFTPTTQPFVIISNDGTDAVTGTFASSSGIPAGYMIDYMYNDSNGMLTGGNDVALVVPEPSTWAGGALALGSLIYLRLRKRSRAAAVTRNDETHFVASLATSISLLKPYQQQASRFR